MGFGDALFTCDRLEEAVDQYDQCFTLPSTQSGDLNRLRVRSFFGNLGLCRPTEARVALTELPPRISAQVRREKKTTFVLCVLCAVCQPVYIVCCVLVRCAVCFIK